MIAMQVKLNGSKVAVAGADQGSVLSSDITIRNDPKRPHRYIDAVLNITGGYGDNVLKIFADSIKLKVGDKADVTFDAIDGLQLEGEVSYISLTSTTNSNGIVSYLVRGTISNTATSPVRQGMTASINFITAEKLNVLTVPVAIAIVRMVLL